MKRLVWIMVAVMALVSPLLTSAQEIDLETAVALALESNLGIESTLAEVRQKKLVADTWWNRFYPSASASVTLGRSNTASEASGLAPFGTPSPITGAYDQVIPFSQEQPRWFMSAGIDLNLVLSMQMVPGISLSRLDYENGLISLAEARAQVERDVSKQFYDLILLKRRIALQEQQIANAERRYEQAQANFDNGLIDEYNLLSSQVSLENQRPALTGLETSYQQALLAFKNSIGLPLAAEIEPTGEIQPPAINFDTTEVERAVLRQRFDIQQLEKAAQLLREQRRASDLDPQTGRAPYVRFGFNVDPSFSGDPWNDTWFDGDNWSQRSGAFTISVVQPLDAWLPHSRTRNQLSDFEMQLERNRLNVEQALRGAEISVRGLLLQIRNSSETLRALERNVELAQRAYDLAEVGYNNGLRDLLEVQTAEVELQDAELNLLEEKKNIMDSVLDLEYEMNATLNEIREIQQ